jgi:uncharacterized protein (TIGR02444 family)
MKRSDFPDNDTLWQDICALYERDSVMARCLRIQESYGLCITLLLLGIALGKRGIALHAGAAPALSILIAQQYFQVLAPLRMARRAMRGKDTKGYEDAKQLELALERNLLDEAAAIWRARALWNAEEAIYRNIDTILDAHGDELPDAAYAASGNLGKLLDTDD